MEERRRFVRLTTRLPASYKVIGSEDSLPSLTRDVGGGGICLFTESRLAPGTVLQVEVQFPTREQPVKSTAEVIWSGPLILEGKDQPPRAFETGVQFLEISPADRAFIIEYATSPRSALSKSDFNR